MEVKVDKHQLDPRDHPRSQWLVVAAVVLVVLDIKEHQDHIAANPIVEMEMVVLEYNSHNLKEV